MSSLPEKEYPETVNKVWSNFKIQLIPAKRINRKTNAKLNPMSLAFFLFSAGNLSVSKEMKMMLSIPKIISRKISVTRDIKISELIV